MSSGPAQSPALALSPSRSRHHGPSSCTFIAVTHIANNIYVGKKTMEPVEAVSTEEGFEVSGSPAAAGESTASGVPTARSRRVGTATSKVDHGACRADALAGKDGASVRDVTWEMRTLSENRQLRSKS